jgi:hypothetical protein
MRLKIFALIARTYSATSARTDWKGLSDTANSRESSVGWLKASCTRCLLRANRNAINGRSTTSTVITTRGRMFSYFARFFPSAAENPRFFPAVLGPYAAVGIEKERETDHFGYIFRAQADRDQNKGSLVIKQIGT